MKSKLLAAAQLRAQLEKAKSDWLDGAMKKILPPEIFDKCMTGSGNDRLAVQRYMVRHHIRLVDEPHRAALTQNGRLLTEMTVQAKRGKILILTRDYPEPKANL